MVERPKKFLCGVIEGMAKRLSSGKHKLCLNCISVLSLCLRCDVVGFYGRPWTFEQRIDLFSK